MLSEESAGRLIQARGRQVDESVASFRRYFEISPSDAELLFAMLDQMGTGGYRKTVNEWANRLVQKGKKGDELLEELADLIVINLRFTQI